MTNEINRIRENYDDIFDKVYATTFHSHQYNPDGSVNYVHSNSGCSERLNVSDFIGDAVSRTRTNDWHSGYFPSSPCFHMKTDFSPIGFYRDYTTYNGFPVKFDIDGRPSLLSMPVSDMETIIGAPDALIGGFTSRIPDDLRSSLSEQAFNYFSDVFPTHLSFAEFVQGFLEAKALLPSLGDSVGKTISGGYLNKSFGWDNLLSDLDTIGVICKTVIARMDFFHKTYGIPTRLGFSRGGVYDPTLSSHTFTIHHSFGIWSARFSIASYKADFRATAWIMQHLEYVSDLAGFFRTMIGALGLNNPVKAFWNTVPLSFVVDWFFNISQHLDHLTRLNPAMGWDVTNMTNSVTYTIRWKVEQLGYPGLDTSEVIQTQYFDQIVYERGVGLSFPWELLNPEELSKSQLTLLLAMLHQLS